MKGQKAHQRIMIHKEVQRTHHSPSPSGMCGDRGTIIKKFFVGSPLQSRKDGRSGNQLDAVINIHGMMVASK